MKKSNKKRKQNSTEKLLCPKVGLQPAHQPYSRMPTNFGVTSKDIIAVLKKHPKAYENAKKHAKTLFENIEKLNALFK